MFVFQRDVMWLFADSFHLWLFSGCVLPSVCVKVVRASCCHVQTMPFTHLSASLCHSDKTFPEKVIASFQICSVSNCFYFFYENSSFLNDTLELNQLAKATFFKVGDGWRGTWCTPVLIFHTCFIVSGFQVGRYLSSPPVNVLQTHTSFLRDQLI